MSFHRSPTTSAAPPAAPGTHPDVLISPVELSRFDIAIAIVLARYTAEQWMLLEPGKRTTSIYAELQRLDTNGGKPRPAAK